MARSRVMRSAVSGWVENIRIMVCPENGLAIINELTGPALVPAASGLARVTKAQTNAMVVRTGTKRVVFRLSGLPSRGWEDEHAPMKVLLDCERGGCDEWTVIATSCGADAAGGPRGRNDRRHSGGLCRDR